MENDFGMREPSWITTSPDKASVSCWMRKGVSVNAFVTPLVAQLKVQRSNLHRLTIISKPIEVCSINEQLFNRETKEEITEPLYIRPALTNAHTEISYPSAL